MTEHMRVVLIVWLLLAAFVLSQPLWPALVWHREIAWQRPLGNDSILVVTTVVGLSAWERLTGREPQRLMSVSDHDGDFRMVSSRVTGPSIWFREPGRRGPLND